MAKFANIIVDISHGKLDKTFQYSLPEKLQDRIEIGMQLEVPFGSRKITGYVIELTDTPEYDVSKIKPVIGLVEGAIPIESKLIALAYWIKRNFGGTFNQALKTVIPVKQKQKHIVKKIVSLSVLEVEAKEKLTLFEAKHNTARARLLRELIKQGSIEQTVITQKLNVSTSVIKALKELGIVKIEETTEYRNPLKAMEKKGYNLVLNEMQQRVVDTIRNDLQVGRCNTYLLKGVTGSGKTEIYMELIDDAIKRGEQAIVLIPEIALTYQTVMRFYNRFGDKVSMMNSKLSQGERCDQFERAKKGEIQIMIGPRSALFTPFPNLGIIIVDEEHETSYKSETVPKYHARDVAVQRSKLENAIVVLGSATPSLDSYYKAQSGEYKLLELNKRVAKKPLPECEVVDLRTELRKGNRSILSTRLQELIEDRLNKKQQIMLFINRRGLAGFVSCRACGKVMKCPHCDVSLSQHGNGRLVCHYCGYTTYMPKFCPSCGSKYIAGFKAGTQKIEEIVQQRFPQAKTLRMDFDTTRTKGSYENILSAFANGEADILIGTQMIVKGHDFSNVTLVGVLAADLSLHLSDFHSAERTFQLLTQAAGRAGRGDLPGNVVIQTYDPEHYAVETSKKQNYEEFYEKEIAYRKLMRYPPVWNMLVIMCYSKWEKAVDNGSKLIAQRLSEDIEYNKKASSIQVVGPADASIAKINDVYRKVIYLRTKDYQSLVDLKDYIEQYIRDNYDFSKVTIQFDFNPVNGF
ncbi:replication restart DNA helicase PriA [Lachnospiraceae bacterium C7]|nr:replication restart DNA helicase PriA [Lachnospiraceae bacterium C7]